MSKDNFDGEIDRVLPEIIRIRRDIHAHPELSFRETRTSALVQDFLKGLGYDVRSNMATTGVLGYLKGSSQNKTIAFRADMDALPVAEATGLPYSSRTEGTAHACGHDGHTAILLGFAKLLGEHPELARVNVKLIFQPAEESGGGGKKMCEEGALADPNVDAIFALHDWPFLKVGEIGIKYGSMMANSDGFKIRINGKGGHAGYPHEAVDPIPITAKVIENFQTIVSRLKNPISPGVLTVGKIHGGTAGNVIPDSVELEGTVRTLDESTRSLVLDSVKKVLESTTSMFGANYELKVTQGYPATVNHDKMVDLVIEAGKESLGESYVKILPSPSMGAEDFAFYLQRVPGAIFRLGIKSDDGGHSVPLHSSRFDFNDNAIKYGIRMFYSILSRFAAGYKG